MSFFASIPPVLENAHLFLLHLPIGLVVAALLLEFWTWRQPEGRFLVEKALAANAFFAVWAAAAGLVLANRGDYPESALALHRWAGVACAVTAVLAWWLRARRGVLAGRVGLGLVVVATGIAGHLGATLTHGDGLIAWSTTPQTRVVSVPSESAPPAGVFTEIHPLLVTHCVECHGPERQRGRLRLDTLAAAKRAGSSGVPALVPGEVGASELLRRIGLPRSDDEAMPPGERTPLSAGERAALATWVAGMAGD